MDPDLRAVHAEQIGKWGDFLRAETRKLLAFFYTINALVFGFVFMLWAADTLQENAPRGAGQLHTKVITEKVILTLIAASSAQLGTLAVAVGRQIFKLAPA